MKNFKLEDSDSEFINKLIEEWKNKTKSNEFLKQIGNWYLIYIKVNHWDSNLHFLFSQYLLFSAWTQTQQMMFPTKNKRDNNLSFTHLKFWILCFKRRITILLRIETMHPLMKEFYIIFISLKEYHK